jgi:hypothetical protein
VIFILLVSNKEITNSINTDHLIMKTSDKNEYLKGATSAAKCLAAGLLIMLIPGCAEITTDSEKIEPHYENIDGALIYDYDPSTRVGDIVFGTIVCDFENDNLGRNSHGGPVAIEYANGDLVAFHTNASGHNVDAWSEYAISKDGGRTWNMYNKFKYSYDTYQNNPKVVAWVVSGLVTSEGTVVLFIVHMGNDVYGGVSEGVTNLGFMRSYDHGETWTEYQPLDGSFAGFPLQVAVAGETNYVLVEVEGSNGPHVLYVSTDDGRSWTKRSTLPLDYENFYGALCIMEDGRLLAGAYKTTDEHHLYYCISEDEGHTWGEPKLAYLDKKIRDPKLAYLDGRYYLHTRAGHHGEGSRRFVLYQSEDGENWSEGIIISSLAKGHDGYSQNVIINKYKENVPNELMVLYSIAYEFQCPVKTDCWFLYTNSYVFFIRPELSHAN